MKVKILEEIDWDNAMESLSVGAFYLLNVLYRKDIDINDTTLMKHTGYGISTHSKHKKELINKNYLQIKQIGKSTYQYFLNKGL